MANKEVQAPDYIKYPYDKFLMLRFEFLALCKDELEAKIMRIIENAIEGDWERTYRERLAATPKGQEVQMPEDIWVAIPLRYFMDRLLGTVQSEATLKTALKSLIHTKKFVLRKDRTGKYEAPLYTLNRNAINDFLLTLPSDYHCLNMMDIMKQPRKPREVKDPGGQKLSPSKIDPMNETENDGAKNYPHQKLTPSGPKIDPMNERGGGQKLTPTNNITNNSYQHKEDTNHDDANAHRTPSLSSSEKTEQLVQTLRQWREEDAQEEDEGLVSSQTPTIAPQSPSQPLTAQEPITEPTPAEIEPQREIEASGAKQASSYRQQKATEKPSFVVPAAMRERVEQVYKTLDTLRQEVTGEPDQRFIPDGGSDEAICTLLHGRTVTPKRMETLFKLLWNEPRNQKTGWLTREHMTVKYICQEYKAREMALIASEQKAPAKDAVRRVGKYIYKPEADDGEELVYVNLKELNKQRRHA